MTTLVLIKNVNRMRMNGKRRIDQSFIRADQWAFVKDTAHLSYSTYADFSRLHQQALAAIAFAAEQPHASPSNFRNNQPFLYFDVVGYVGNDPPTKQQILDHADRIVADYEAIRQKMAELWKKRRQRHLQIEAASSQFEIESIVDIATQELEGE